MNAITGFGMIGASILAVGCATSGSLRTSGGNLLTAPMVSVSSASAKHGATPGKRHAYVVIAPAIGRNAGKEWLSVIDLPEELNAIFCFTEDRRELLCWTYEDPPAERHPNAWLDARKVLVRIGDQRL